MLSLSYCRSRSATIIRFAHDRVRQVGNWKLPRGAAILMIGNTTEQRDFAWRALGDQDLSHNDREQAEPARLRQRPRSGRRVAEPLSHGRPTLASSCN